MTLKFYETLALPCAFHRSTNVWDAIEELEPTVDKDSYQGDLLLVFLDGDAVSDTNLMTILERRFAAAPGGRDLRFAFAFKTEHAAHHERFRIRDLPAAVFVREGIEIDRCESEDDIPMMVREVIARYR